ncbi:D-alanyl-glycyl endopeptidase-like protein [Trypanosoma theileri]|uniref:D-alanyl-glycyl endopeptidase-like protein n=1 Tax=Trypanosoma theileri TaxID=67003 RepID=A0A1X0NR96_9TRYP|nr:D-alanyl-glycyl endopeptidase-like protein [Trypanosoma theileri]ORC87236.1 D-alanyl-glycyl endopeptidase-like protein [Trypanosoma theileri]
MAAQRKRKESGATRPVNSSKKTIMSSFAKPFKSLPYYIISLFIWGTVASLVCMLLLAKSSREEYSHETINYNSSHSLNNSCTVDCATTFGTILGIHNGIFAYSNCNSTTCISNEWHELEDPQISIAFKGNTTIGNSTGMKWQCVEYARRYWMLRGSPVPATFSAVEGAADIWELQSVQLVNGAKTPLLKYSNGLSISAGGSAPRVGDLLIYPRQKGGFVYGHVAVIVDVLSAAVLVAEQNWDNTVWPGPFHNYSRSIPMQYDANSKAYTLKESDDIIIQGWMRYSK